MFDPAAKDFYIKTAFIWFVIMLVVSTGYIFWTGRAQAFLADQGIAWFAKSQENPENIPIEQKGTPGKPPENDTVSENIEPLPEDINSESSVGTPLIKNSLTEKNALRTDKSPRNPGDKSQPFNILILGIDRRSGDQTHWRTDVIQLVTLSADRSKAVITHIPRDVWAGSYKINSVYNLKGPDAIKDEIEKITGQRPDRIIRIDFDAFVWAIDHAGGLDINVPRSFTDSKYPNDREGKEEIITVEFKSGEQNMDGETALQYVRSRKGTNGEGSDYARGKRQQVVMYAMLGSYFKEGNLFKPKTAQALYNTAVEHIYTDLTVQDTGILFELLKNYKNFKISNFNLDTSNYLVVPNSAEYGGAWTLTAKDNDYSPVRSKILEMIN